MPKAEPFGTLQREKEAVNMPERSEETVSGRGDGRNAADYADDAGSRYSRQMLFAPIGEEGQRKLGESSVLIAGMGALGTVLAGHMVRAGVGHVRIVDRDYVESSNLQRQALYNEDDVLAALPKVEAAARKLRRINSSVTIEPVSADITVRNAAELLEGMDLALDGTDNFATRFLLNDACWQAGIPFAYGGAVSSRGMSALFIPGQTPCLRCFIPSGGAAGETCDTAGVIAPVVDIVASCQATEALKLLVGDEKHRRNSLLSFDIWHNRHYEMKFGEPLPDCPCCGLKQYPALEWEREEAVTMCGRDSVQIAGRGPLELEQWQRRLAPVSKKLTANPYLLRAELREGERLVLFADGRALVQGTTDPVRAKSLYARYIGL